MTSLPSELEAALDRVEAFFRGYPGVVGMYVAGSTATKLVDEHSDLDVGVFFADEDARERAWVARWDWDLGPWFHRFDAEHVRPYFVIYLLDSGVKVDIPLNVVDYPPTPAGAPYEVLWDTTGDVTRWVEAANSGRAELPPDWSEAPREDARFWAWIYYSILHIRRGEYYDVAFEFRLLRDIVETWHARLRGKSFFSVRRVDPETILEFADLFPRPERESLKRALQKLIEVHERQRARVEGVEWTTSPEARERIRAWVDAL